MQIENVFFQKRAKITIIEQKLKSLYTKPETYCFCLILEFFSKAFLSQSQSLYTDIFVFNIFVLSATFLKDKLIDPSKTYICIKIQRDPIANENWDGFNGHRSLHFGDRSMFMLTRSYFHQAGFHPRGCHVYVWGIHIHPCVCMRYPMVTIHPFSISSCRERMSFCS